MSYKVKPGEPRLPMVFTPEEVDKLDFMSEEQKELAKKNLKMIPVSKGWSSLACNPDIQAIWQVMEREMTSLYGDMQATPFNFMFFANALIAKATHDEFSYGFMFSSFVDSIHDFGLGYEGQVKLHMLDFPDCDCWTEDERLCINFINAVIKFQMTDEIMQQAIDAWGEDQVVLNMSWLGYVWFMCMEQAAQNIPWNSKTENFPYGSWSPENVKAVVDSLSDTKYTFRKMWEGMGVFDQDPHDKI